MKKIMRNFLFTPFGQLNVLHLDGGGLPALGGVYPPSAASEATGGLGGVITLPLIPSHQGRGKKLMNREGKRVAGRG